MPKATVAVEDKRYWEHGGDRPDRHHARVLGRRGAGQGRAGRLDDHAAARAQPLHLARADLHAQAARGVPRREARDKWSKQKILTAYLNQVYYGSQAYGVEAAAQTYFSEPAKKLTLAQAALLAGLPQAPSSYDPFANPRRARAAQAGAARDARTRA